MSAMLSPKEIDQLIGRGKNFLRVASTEQEIRQLLVRLGYCERDHALGWNLYLEMAGHVAASAWAATTEAALQNAAEAFARWLHAWQKAALGVLSREEHHALFGLPPHCEDDEATIPVATQRAALQDHRDTDLVAPLKLAATQ